MINWSLCIATLNRPDALKRAIRHVLDQSVAPVQIVIVDASDDWQASHRAITKLLAANPAIRLDYIHSDIQSSSTQRNIGIQASIGDVIFIIDDDSFLYPDCAATVLVAYDADPDGRLAGVRMELDDQPPPLPDEVEAPHLQRKPSGNRSGLADYKDRFLEHHLGRWFHRRVLMQSVEEIFLLYDGPRQSPLPQALEATGAISVSFMPGCAMSVRRDIALAEPFETALRYYAASEDIDVSYRYARHGHLIHLPTARLHHFEAAGGRINRKKVIVFQILNVIVYLRRNANRPDDWIGRFRVMMYRRLLSEFLKDLLSGRFDFPQLRGVLLARRYWRQVWACPLNEIDTRYPELQRHILEQL